MAKKSSNPSCPFRRREEGLAAAIEAAGGVGRLARSLRIRQPSVSAWTRVPAHHVILVEALTRINRRVLRPDLYDVAELDPSEPEAFSVGQGPRA